MPSFVFQKRKQQVCYLKGTQSPKEQAWQWAGTQDSSCLPAWGHAQGLTTRCLSHAALPFCPADHVPSNMRGKRVRSHQDHSKTLQRFNLARFSKLQSNKYKVSPETPFPIARCNTTVAQTASQHLRIGCVWIVQTASAFQRSWKSLVLEFLQKTRNFGRRLTLIFKKYWYNVERRKKWQKAN